MKWLDPKTHPLPEENFLAYIKKYNFDEHPEYAILCISRSSYDRNEYVAVAPHNIENYVDEKDILCWMPLPPPMSQEELEIRRMIAFIKSTGRAI